MHHKKSASLHWLRSLTLIAAVLAPALAFGGIPGSPTTMPLGKKFHIQSAQNYGRDTGGYWDVPGDSQIINRGANIQIWSLNGGVDRVYTFVASPVSGWYEMYLGDSPQTRVDVNKGSSKKGTNIQVWERTGGSAQRFFFRHIGNGRFKIYTHHGKIINLKHTNAKNGNNVQIWNDHDGIHNEWYVIDAATKQAFIPGAQTNQAPAPKELDGFVDVPIGKRFFIQSAQNYGRNNNGYWDVPGRSKIINRGDNIQIWALDDGIDRKFTFHNSKVAGQFEISVGDSPVTRVDVDHGRKDKGTNIKVWESNGAPAQRFRFRHLGDGRFKIYDSNGMILNLKDTNDKNGNNVQIWSDHNGLHNEWYLIDAGTRKAFIPTQQPTKMAPKRPKLFGR